MIACGVKMFLNRGMVFKVFFKPFYKSSFRVLNILLIILYPVTPIPAHHSTFMCDSVLIFESHKEALDGIASIEVYFYLMFIPNFLKALTKTISVGHYYVDAVSFFIASFVVAIGVVFVMIFNFNMALPSAMTINKTFYLPHTIVYLTGQIKREHTALMSSTVLLFIKYSIFLRPDEATMKT